MNGSMKAVFALPVLVALVPASSVADAPTGAPAVIEMDCAKLGTISLSKGKSTYKIAGTCTKISVASSENTLLIENAKNLAITGSKNRIAIGKTDKIAVMGTSNTLTYEGGLTLAAPKIAVIGKGNTVTARVGETQ
jgi:hypothetical protein